MKEAEGVELYTSPTMASGYTCVVRSRTGRFFEAYYSHHGTKKSLGTFDTAVEAAVAYARHRRAMAVGAREDGGEHSSDEGASGSSSGDDSDDVEDEISEDEIVEDESPSDAEARTPEETAAAAVAGRERRNERRQVAHNLTLEPRLHMEGESGVVAVSVSAEAATACAHFLRERWRDGALVLPGCSGGQDPVRTGGQDPVDDTPKAVTGWTTYSHPPPPSHAA